jgi:phage terminase small subunit
LVIKTPKSGYPIPNPYVGIANTALEQMRRWAVEFGMTPSARSRIHVEHSGGNGGGISNFEDFMRSIGAPDEPEDTHDDEQIDLIQQQSDKLRP